MRQANAEEIDALANVLIEALSEAVASKDDTISLTDMLHGSCSSSSLQRLKDLLTPPDVRAVDVLPTEKTLEVILQDERMIGIPLEKLPRLAKGSQEQRDAWRLVAGGIGIHWEDLDEDILVNDLLATRPLGTFGR